MAEPTPLGKYILDLCKRQGMSMREASVRAGLGTETIGEIVRRRRTSQPRPYTLQAIARALGGSYRHMMYLAGHEEGIDESRSREADEIAQQVDSLPEGVIRDEAIESIRAILGRADWRTRKPGE